MLLAAGRAGFRRGGLAVERERQGAQQTSGQTADQLPS
jgi:hypothetical protein